MTQQDDITQRVLTDDEIQALWDEACKDSPQAPGWNRHIRFARALLSKVAAPVAGERATKALNRIERRASDDGRQRDIDDLAVVRAALASAPVAGEAVYTLRVRGAIQAWTPTAAAFSIPDGEHQLFLSPAAPQASECECSRKSKAVSDSEAQL